MGALILSAIGNTDPAAIPEFALLGDTIGAWSITNIECKPGTMASVGAAVGGFGSLKVQGEALDLGTKLATAMKDPSDDGIKTWTKFATALLEHFETFGQVLPVGFVAPTPTGGPLTGVGKMQFASLVFAPLLQAQLEVEDETAGAMLEVFGAQILSHIAAHAVVVPIPTQPPFIPFTAPTGGGPISGAGAIT